MPERQTKENLQRVIDEEMEVFGLEYKQILSVTSDNGINMLAAVRYMKQLMGDTVEGSLANILSQEYAIFKDAKVSPGEEIDGSEGSDSDEAKQNFPELQPDLLGPHLLGTEPGVFGITS